MIDRWKLTRDGDGHWFCIKVVDEPKFVQMLHDGEADDWCAFNAEFGRYAIGGSPSLVTFQSPSW